MTTRTGRPRLAHNLTFAIFVCIAISCATSVYADLPPGDLPPIEAYGERASLRSMALSPDGTRIAFLQVNKKGEEALLVHDLKEGFLTGIKLSLIHI